jgi:hypothetical protein
LPISLKAVISLLARARQALLQHRNTRDDVLVEYVHEAARLLIAFTELTAGLLIAGARLAPKRRKFTAHLVANLRPAATRRA